MDSIVRRLWYAQVAIVCISALSAWAQALHPATAANASQFLGTWQAQFQGKTFATLKIIRKGNAIAGSMSNGNIELNHDGEITSAVQTDGEDPIDDARTNGEKLRISVKSENGSEDSTQFDFTLVGPDDAELQFIGMPSNVPKPKPWQFHRFQSQ